MDQLLKVQVWDDDTFSDDMIGEGTVNLTQCYQNPNRTENEYVDLIHRGKSAGRVLLSL
jgi:Ca2+-dependent lipid-binding protein